MKIDFNKLIENSNVKNHRQLAREMVEAGRFKNLHVAVNTIQNFISGKGKTISLDLLLWIRDRFGVNIIDFFKYDE